MMVVNESEALIIGQICPVSLKTTVIMSSSVTAQSVTDNIFRNVFPRLSRNRHRQSTEGMDIRH